MTESRDIKVAVVREKDGPYSIENAKLRAPLADEVIVKIVAAGMCHTDASVRRQLIPGPLPIVLGHEGAGIIEEVGADVADLKPGDRVVMSYAFCGECKLCQNGRPYNCERLGELNFAGVAEGGTAITDEAGNALGDGFFGQSSFASYSLAKARTVVKVEDDVPLELLGPLGCGIQTGAGASLNALKVTPGSTFVVFGTGAVGLSALMGAVIAGAEKVIAVDVVPSRLELAKELGATHVVNSKEVNAVEAVLEITGGGVDFAVESSGIPAVLRQAIDSLGIGGTVAVVGAPGAGVDATFDVMSMITHGRRIIGVSEGQSVASEFIPELVRHYKEGRFPFDKLVKTFSFDEINEAEEESAKGVTLKPILVMA